MCDDHQNGIATDHNSSSTCLRPIMGVSQGARAKYRLADPHQRGSFLDGDLEIAGHPHRQALETHSVRRAVTQRLAQVPHQPETAAHSLFIGREHRQRHQSLDAQSVKSTQFFYKVRERSEEHKSELQSLMRISYAVFCLKNKKKNKIHKNNS